MSPGRSFLCGQAPVHLQEKWEGVKRMQWLGHGAVLPSSYAHRTILMMSFWQNSGVSMIRRFWCRE